MKLLIVSDTHMFNDILKNINDHLIEHMDYCIHCGDSSLKKDDPLLKPYDIIVEGNHDDKNDFPPFFIFNNILITHGHLYNIYKRYDDLIELCHQNHCDYCIHGHTHVPEVEKIEDITFINPGSTMINRGSYGFGTFIVCDYNNQIISNIQFYNSETLKPVDSSILDEGKTLLKEFREIANKLNK